MKNNIIRIIKKFFLYGSFFIFLSISIDWYRKPELPLQFSEQVFNDIHQQPKLISQLSHNRPLLIYFWGNWCHFCEFTSPSVDRLFNEGIEILSIALKSGSDEEVKQYLEKQDYQFVTLNDPYGILSKNWGIQATPTFIIVKNGKIISHTTGFSTYWGLKIRLWLADMR